MSDFIKTKSSMCLALYHLEELSYMLCITNKAIYNQFKGLVFMVSASLSATHGASLEERAALQGQHRETGANSSIVSSCYRGVLLLIAFPFPTTLPVLGGSPCLALDGTRSAAPVLPPALLALLARWCGLQTRWCFLVWRFWKWCLSSYEVAFSI